MGRHCRSIGWNSENSVCRLPGSVRHFISVWPRGNYVGPVLQRMNRRFLHCWVYALGGSLLLWGLLGCANQEEPQGGEEQESQVEEQVEEDTIAQGDTASQEEGVEKVQVGEIKEDLQSSLEEVEDSLDQFEKRIEKTEEVRSEVEEQLSDLREQSNQIREDIELLADTVNINVQNVRNDLQSRLADLHYELSVLRFESINTKEQFERAMDEQIEIIDALFEDIQKQLQEAATDVNLEYEEQITSLKEDRQELQLTLEEFRQGGEEAFSNQQSELAEMAASIRADLERISYEIQNSTSEVTTEEDSV